jgi:hypothetical protein
MNKMKILGLLVLLNMGLVPATIAQSYVTTLGLRLGNGNAHRQVGLTFQQKLAGSLTLEGVIQTDFRDNHTVHALLERHRPLIGKRVNWYYGAGLSLGSEESWRKDPETRIKEFTYGNKTVSADLIGGVELTFAGLNVSWDVKPNFNLTGRSNWMTLQTAISVRSVIFSSRQSNKRKRQRARDKKEKKGFLGF